MDKIFAFITGEFVLKSMPNGGKAVIIRTLFVSGLIYIIAIALKSSTSPNSIFEFSLDQLCIEISATITWLGAIIAGTYAALYSRFSSQWSYLTGLYNQQISLSITLTDDQLNGENYVRWQAAFIEDAVNLHLAEKSDFSTLIHEMIKEDKIKNILIETEHFGLEKFDALEVKLTKIVKAKQQLTKIVKAKQPNK